MRWKAWTGRSGEVPGRVRVDRTGSVGLWSVGNSGAVLGDLEGVWVGGEDNGVLRSDRLLVVCDRCRPGSETRGWVASLRRRLHARAGNDSANDSVDSAVTVTTSGCVRTCSLQSGRAAVVLAGAAVGCREWAVDLDSTAELEGIAEVLSRWQD